MTQIVDAPYRFHTARAWPAVPWSTVLPLAVVLAYGDGFWTTSFRGAVGSIGRTDAPFTSWLRESTLLLPVFVLAVLLALMQAQRRYGVSLRRAGPVLATGLLVVAAGTLTGIAELVTDAGYDYHLQSGQLTMMETMRGGCAAGCLAQQQHATWALHLQALGYGSTLVLGTNLLVVGWVLALRGGHLRLATRVRGSGIVTRIPGATAPVTRQHQLALALAAGLLGSAVIHAAVVPEHLREWHAAGAFFVALAVAQTAAAVLVLIRRGRWVLPLVAALSAGALALWLVSRTVGLPLGPEPGTPERIGLADVASCALELVALLMALHLLRTRSRGLLLPASANLTRLSLVAVVAVTAIGLGGTDLGWLTFVSPTSHMAMPQAPG